MEMTSFPLKEPRYQGTETLEPTVQIKEPKGREEREKESQERRDSPPLSLLLLLRFLTSSCSA